MRIAKSGTVPRFGTFPMPDCQLYEYYIIGQNVVIFPKVKLGKIRKRQNNVSIYSGVLCGDAVFLRSSMAFTNIGSKEYRLVGQSPSGNSNQKISSSKAFFKSAILRQSILHERHVNTFKSN